MITQQQIQTITKVIADNYQPHKIIPFGSYAEGTPNEDSDLDFLIIKETNIPQHHRAREITKFLRGSKIPMDIFVYTKSEIENWKNVKQSFISQILEKGKVVYG